MAIGDILLVPSSSATDGDIRLSTGSVSDVLYLGYDTKFSGAKFKLESTGSLTSGVSWKLWDGSNWTTAQSISETVTNLKNFGSTTEGIVYWATASTWVPNDVNGEYYYWVRVESNRTSGTDIPPVISYIGVDSTLYPVAVAVGYSFGYILD